MDIDHTSIRHFRIFAVQTICSSGLLRGFRIIAGLLAASRVVGCQPRQWCGAPGFPKASKPVIEISTCNGQYHMSSEWLVCYSDLQLGLVDTVQQVGWPVKQTSEWLVGSAVGLQSYGMYQRILWGRWVNWFTGISRRNYLCLRNGWVNTREAGDLRRHQAHYDVIVIRSRLTLDLATLINLATSINLATVLEPQNIGFEAL